MPPECGPATVEPERLDDELVGAEPSRRPDRPSSPFAVTTMIGTSERARNRRQTRSRSCRQTQVEQDEIGHRRDLECLLPSRRARPRSPRTHHSASGCAIVSLSSTIRIRTHRIVARRPAPRAAVAGRALPALGVALPGVWPGAAGGPDGRVVSRHRGGPMPRKHLFADRRPSRCGGGGRPAGRHAHDDARHCRKLRDEGADHRQVALPRRLETSLRRRSPSHSAVTTAERSSASAPAPRTLYVRARRPSWTALRRRA